MGRVRATLFFLALILVASSALSCGSHGQGQLQAITINPGTAEGQAQFIATGHYIDPSQTVTPFSATWTACSQGNVTSDIVISQSGTAQCTNNDHGTYSISASGFKGPPGPIGCPAANPCGTSAGCTVIGDAQLTCP